MKVSPQITWRGGGLLRLAVLVLCGGVVAMPPPSGPSERPEAYFNGSSFIRINRPLSLRHIAGLSYRTCVGGELFVQRSEGHTLHVTALLDKVVVAWQRPGQAPREQSVPLRTLDNRWHFVALRHTSDPPALTLQLDEHERVVANASLHPWLLAADKLQADGATLLVGNLFSGCMYEGPQLEFHAANTVVSNVEFGPCPLATEACKDGKDVLRVPPKDHCYNEPCLLRGTCVSRHDRYECHCAARYSGNNCELDKGDPCASSPCAHGRCHEDEFGNYRCTCDPHYHGAHCELADVVDPQCKSSPCKNNGSCEVTSPGAPYMCLCPAGFSGRHCEVNDDDCTAGACENGGKCIDGINGYTCDCTDTGYRGLRCETNVNECASGRPCGPGVCYDTYGGFVCVCPPQYGGDRCQKASACASGPCGGGGTCMDGVDGYTCLCAAQWTGARCEVPLVCEVLDCGPHSHCQQLMTRATCVCDAGYHGPAGVAPVCLAATMACAGGVCGEGGTCRLTAEGVECACAPGRRGQYCELAAAKAHADGCAAKTCVHADVCVDTVSGYECACASGWGGARCDVQTPGAHACVATQDGYRCTCKGGRTGKLCERAADCRTEGCARGQACSERGAVWQCRDAPCTGVDCRAGVCRPLDATQYRCECLDNYTGRHCEVDVDECASNSKLCNFGVCVNVPGSYECYCKPGYTGASCEQDIDECLSAPCKNNATCHNMENKYECTCTNGFQGKDCSVDIDECASSPCSAGATCTDGIGRFTCACPPGITGRLCDVDIDDCESNPCHNGGRCVDKLASFECECAGTGFSGALCDTDIDECASQPCRNGATCSDQNNDYKCLCHPGFTGKDCETDVDECASSPCHYGGVCLQRSDASLYRPAGAPPERVGPQPHMLLPASFYAPYSTSSAAGYVCVCVAGTAGARCDVDVDECASSPCAHGKCEDRIGGYACRCDEGYEGEHCDVDIDECARYMPCVHGHCLDRRASYHCECAEGWGGRNCSVRLRGCDGQPCKAGGTCRAWLSGETEHRYNCTCRAGRWGDTCDRVTTMSLEKSSYAEVNTSREEGYDVSFRFKTTLSSGLLAMGRGLTYFFLELSSGRLNLHSSLLNKWEGVFIGSNLNDSNWQKVFVTINSSHLVLAANEEQTIYPISQNEAYNSSVTSFPTTRLGTAGSSFATLTHGPNFFVGCFQDVVVNGQWVLPEREASAAAASGALLAGVQPECPRVPQCEPNPCRSGGQCRDDWTAFSCHCPRPYLGHTCQFNYTAATFGHESRPRGGRVAVAVSESARLAVHAALDISMFVRTRKPHGQVFYLGSAPGSPDETLVAATLKNGELLVHLRFNHTQEDYTVGGTRLDNGHVHLIQVVRNSTLVQVKLNGTEYFRKSISAAKQLDAQVLYIGGPPPSPEVTAPTTAAPAHLTDDNEFFKGVIQDVQISNGVTSHVVEFFPLSSPGLSLPPSFGAVKVDAGVLPGVRSDDLCVSAPCMNNATCKVTWNDYVCDCPRGYKGKQCADVEFCQLQGCPANTLCRNLQGGYECLSNATFDGAGTVLRYRLRPGDEGNVDAAPDSLTITYRSRVGGTLLHATLGDAWFSVGAYHGKVTVAWRLPGAEPQQRSMRTARGHAEDWTELSFALTAHQIKGAFVREGTEEVGISAEMNTSAWRVLVTRGDILLGGVALRDSENTTVAAFAALSTTETDAEGATELWAGDNSAGELFKGCMGPVRVGGLLLPFFSEAELFKSAASDVLRARSHFALLEGEPWGGAPDCLLCLERSCMHGSHCSDVHRSYACSCPPGYSGDRCETDDDECLAHRCQHGATCVDRVAGYECQCPPGYAGEHCESDVDECVSTPCLNGGACTNTPGGYACSCTAAWSGALCDVPKHRSCRHAPCHQHATCVDKADPSTGNNYTCVCAEGFSGAHCEVAYCEREPCVHGECVTLGARAHCSCQAGYSGVYCEAELDECALAGEPCANGGRCIDRIGAYYCDCDNTGWQGVHCEEDVDECASERVNCGLGNCSNHRGGYTCECERGFCGHECKLPDPCTPANGNASGPCERGECLQRCADKVAHVCLCPDGWSGQRCAQRLAGAAATSGGKGAIVGGVAAVAVLILCVCVAVGVSRAARRKRATRGTYSPSGQEYCNPRANAMQHALKPPPEERLI